MPCNHMDSVCLVGDALCPAQQGHYQSHGMVERGMHGMHLGAQFAAAKVM